MKKVTVLLIMILIISLSSCGKIYPVPEVTEVITQKANEKILEAIENNEPEKIKKLFCKSLLKKHENIDEEVKEFIDFIDGDIVSVGRQYGGPAGSTTQYPYGLLFERYSGSIVDIETDKGKRYRIRYYGYRVNQESPDKIGITAISVIDSDKHKETGSYEGARYQIGLGN